MRVINKSRGQNAAWVLGAALLGVAISSVPARAQGDETIIGGTTQATQDVLPEGGLSLVPADVLTSLKLGGKAAANAQVQIVPIEGQPFAQALRITTTGKSAEGDITLSVDTTRTFREVETVFIRFYFRTLASEAADGYGAVKSNLEANAKGGARVLCGHGAR